MAKSLILANGTIFVGLNQNGFVSDFFYPYVGVENHVRGSAHKIGVWMNGYLSWLDSGEWNIEIDLDKNTFVGVMKCYHKHTNLELIFRNVVYNEKNIFIRHVEVINHTEETKDIKIFFHQVFCIYGTSQEDTAYYDPIKNAIIHYEGRRVFFVYAEASDVAFNDYSIGLYGIEGREGVYKDAEDGRLEKNPIEHGRIDSILSLPLTLHRRESKTLNYWITVAETKNDAAELHDYVKYKSAKHLVESTSHFWEAWLTRQDYIKCSLTEDRQIDLFKKSLFYVRGNIDTKGAIIASGDSDMLQHGRDTYSYMWPRDGAMTVMALLQVGEYNISKHFFKFCNDVLEPDGYLMHKYRADKSLGSSWHSFIKDGKPILPIQEDETALVLVALWEYYQKTKDIEFIELHYSDVIKRMGTFLLDFIDNDTGLPLPSYDLWEEKHGTSTFTSCTVYAALIAAHKFANLFLKKDEAEAYNKAAERMKRAILDYLYDDHIGMFVKHINRKNGTFVYDRTIDMSSIFAVYNYGILPIDDYRVVKSIKTVEEKLRLNTGIDGVPRYVQDNYYKQVDNVPNPWYITTLWLAQYYIHKASKNEDLDIVRYWLNWVVTHSPRSGVLSEQLHPFTGEQLSANPLTWSHAEYVRTVMLYHNKLQALGLCIPRAE
jgi:GH15 family glucan-1,4-alpha-glucosidase